MLRKRKTLDGLKIQHALPRQFLIPLVAAMTFLAAFMLAGSYASQSLAQRWNAGAASTVILQIPEMEPDILQPAQAPLDSTNSTHNPSRIDSIIALLSTSKELTSFHKLSDEEITALLSPWLHGNIHSFALPIPTVIELHPKENGVLSKTLQNRLKTIAPDLMLEQGNFWNQRLNILANSLQSVAFIALSIVILVTMTVIALSTRTGLVQCRQTIEILHHLGASDSYICFRFAKRSALLAFTGGGIGSLLALPFLLFLTYLALPFSNNPEWQALFQQGWLAGLTVFPFEFIISSIMLPICSYLIGWFSTTLIVYFWLKYLT